MIKPKLSVTIITLDEEKDLPRALASIKNLADEVILVDSGSADKTIEIAKGFGVKILTRRFDNYANQKNFAAQSAEGEWILSLDADEEISGELADEIKDVIHSDKYDAYSIPRRNIILGKFIKFTRWQPELDRHIWLWKKDKGKWIGDVHEELTINGSVGRLKNYKIHHQYETVAEFLGMMNRYSELEADQKFKSGVRFSYSRFVWDPFYNFAVRYFYRLGFLDGWRGFVLSYLMAIYHLEIWVKVWEKQK